MGLDIRTEIKERMQGGTIDTRLFERPYGNQLP